VVGHVCQCRKLAFNFATRNADEHSQLISNSDKDTCYELQDPATADGKRILGWTGNRNHKVSLKFQALDDSLAFGCSSLRPLVPLGGVVSTRGDA